MPENNGFDARKRIAKELSCILILSRQRHETPEETAEIFIQQGLVKRYSTAYREHPDFSPEQLVELMCG